MYFCLLTHFIALLHKHLIHYSLTSLLAYLFDCLETFSLDYSISCFLTSLFLTYLIAYILSCLLTHFSLLSVLNFLFNLLTPNVNYSGRTAPLTSKVAFYIFIQQI